MKKIITKASGLVIACTTPLAMGFTFETETLNGSFDSTITAGMGLRTESRGCNLINQGPTGHNAPSGCLAQSSGVADQGDLNYDRGDMFTNYLKGTHELLLKMPEDITFMARGTWIRDFAATDTTGTLSFNTPESVGSNGLSDDARDDLAFKARLLDLWVSKGFDVGGQRVRARLGNQVINWGESLFVAGGINNTNAYDYQALARPGVQLKEAVLPAPMLSVASGLGSGVNVEAYYQFRWNKSELPPVGSYWSTTNALGEGRGDYGFSEKDARDSGQWGLALRWYAAELNDTEFGLYAMNYHSRNPYYSVIAGNGLATSDPVTGRSTGYYFIDYPEDIRLYGLSFQTNIGSTSVAGELSYRPNMPLQINSTDMSIAAIYPTTLFGNPIYDSGFATPRAGEVINGYVRKPVTQAQVTVTQFFDRVLAADRLTVVGEVGYNHLSGVDGDDLRYGRDAIYGIGELPNNALCTGALNVANPQECNSHGFYTRNSWGYRLRGILEYPNVFAGVNLKPNLAWSHDVEGYGPNFSEGAKAVSVGLDADYQNTYTASISYTDFFGGNYNPINDRDFLAVSFGVNF